MSIQKKLGLWMAGGSPPEWGYCESVLVDAGRVICTPGGPKGALAALDAATGKLVWQAREFTDPAQYASPIVFAWAGVRQYAQLTMKSLVGVQASDGKLLWKSDWPGQTAVIPTPIYRDGHVYISSGYGVGSKLVRLATDQSVSDVYVNKVMKNQHGGVILIGDHLYGYSDGAGWTCQDFKTGGNIAVKVAPEKGVGMFECYLDDPEENARVFRQEWYFTGDKAYADADGYYYFFGRADDVIKSSAHRIGPFEVESVLQEHEAVAESAVVGSPDAMRGEAVKAFVVLAPGREPSQELARQIQDFVKMHTASYKCPREIEFVEELPKTISGKIKRAVLKRMEMERKLGKGDETPRI